MTRRTTIQLLIIVPLLIAVSVGTWILADRYASALPPTDYACWPAGYESADNFLLVRSDPSTGEMVMFLDTEVVADLEVLRQLLEQHRKGEHQLIAVSVGPNVSVEDMAKVRKVCRDSKTGIVPYEPRGYTQP